MVCFHILLAILSGSSIAWIALELRMLFRCIPWPSASPVTSLLLIPSLVVEFDIPWDNDQMDKYGGSFKAWGEDEFSKAWNGIRRALPYNNLAVVVYFHAMFCIGKYSTGFFKPHPWSKKLIFQPWGCRGKSRRILLYSALFWKVFYGIFQVTAMVEKVHF